MASNHVHDPRPPQNGAGGSSSMLPGTNDDNFSFNPYYTGHHQNQSFNSGSWNIDPNLSLAPSQSTTSTFSPSWNTTSVQQHNTQHHLPARSTFEDVANNFFTRSFSDSPSPYPTSAFSNGGFNRFSHAPLDSSLVASSTGHSGYTTTTSHAGTIAPAALQSNSSYGQAGRTGTSIGPAQALKDPPKNVPKGVFDGSKFILTDSDAIIKATDSKRFHNFVTITSDSYNFPVSKST